MNGLVSEWRSRPLEQFYPVLVPDALRVNIRDGSSIVKKSVYPALAIRLDGQKELLGLWIEQNGGARFWMGIMNELKNRGVKDILSAAVDGLSGFPVTIAAVFPKTGVQLCIVHMVRNSVQFVADKDRKAVTAGLKKNISGSFSRSCCRSARVFRGGLGQKIPVGCQAVAEPME